MSFRENLILLGIDEAHVVVPWGKDFRQAYHQILALHRRLPSHTALVAVSATISPGKEFNSLCSALELKAGQYHSIRESSERPNVRMVFKTLTHGLGGYQFPDIAWVFKRGVKAVVYCQTIDLCFRVVYYGWNLYPDGCRRLDNVRMWTAISSAAYNSRTLELFKSNEDTSVIVATIAFGMGMNLRNISDSVNLGLPTTYSGLIQQNGRAGRDLEMEARGWTYVESSVCAAIAEEESLAGGSSSSSKTTAGPKSHKRVDDMDLNLRRMVEAHVRGLCLVATANAASGNPGEDVLLTCAQAKRQFFCSSCEPYLSPNAMPSAPPPPPAVAPPIQTTSSAPPLTKKSRENLALWLNDFAIKHWNAKDNQCVSFMPYPAIWTGISQDHILDNFHVMTTRESLSRICAGWKYLSADGDALFNLLEELRHTLDEHTQKQKEERARKSAATRAKNKAIQLEKQQAKENEIPPNMPRSSTTTMPKITIRLPPRPLASLNASLDTWEPPPVEVALQAQLRKRPITIGPLDENNDTSAKRHRASRRP